MKHQNALQAVNARFSTRETRANNPRDWTTCCITPNPLGDSPQLNPYGENLRRHPGGQTAILALRNNPFTQF